MTTKNKLDLCLSRGDFYEAHQIYRTLFFRLSTAEKWDELMDLLHSGAVKLIKAGQFTSATDLGELLIETLQKANIPISTQTLDKFEQIFASIPGALPSDTPTDGQQVDRRSRLLQMALKWSQQVSTRRLHRRSGHPDLHRRLAVIFWNEHNYEISRNHFLLSDDAETFATFLIECHQTGGFNGEVDLFVSQAVLQKRSKIASNLLQHYSLRHPQISQEPPYRFPLLNFIWLLTLCVEVKKVTYFTILIEQYQPSLQRDPSYRSYLDKIGQIFFGLPPPKSHQHGGGAFASIIKGLMGNNDNTGGEDPGDSSGSDSDSYHNAIDEENYLSAASSAGSLVTAQCSSSTVNNKKSMPVDIDLD